MNLDETQTNSKETVSVSKAASAASCSKCGEKWRRLNDSDLQREDVCDNDKDENDEDANDIDDYGVIIKNNEALA